MKSVLFAWVGMTDLKASNGVVEAGLGPIAQAVEARPFDKVVLLWNLRQEEAERYCAWLRQRKPLDIQLHIVSLSGPTEFSEIYQGASKVIQAVLDELKAAGESPSVSFHLSPGTPAMAAVWIILAKTRFPAELIESSRERGVRTASVPFDISADFLPDLLRKPDEELVRLSQGLPPEAPEFAAIIHRCVPMKHMVARARRVAPRSIPVLLLGESGTGKELLARAIHFGSPRKAGQFVAVNCGAIPSELVESELFGHEKGAFTGAFASRPGYLEAADGGTLFLDEVAELPLQAQVKLLRALQEKEVVRVGGNKPKKIDFRVIAATNRDLVDEVARGRFREDLFHRVAVAVLQVPPLRDRQGDLTIIVDHLLSVVNKEAAGQPGYQEKKLSAGARSLLLRHSWPGNVRELANTLQRAAIWSSGPRIEEGDIREALLPMQKEVVGGILNRPLGTSLDIRELTAEVARHYLQRALEETNGNKSRAAKLVGLPNYQTFSNWARRLGLDI